MLEKMAEFFERRLDEYDRHQLTCIESAPEFYTFTSKCLPALENARILDLGCGTGLELEGYLEDNPTAEITGIDLSPRMLEAAKKKFPGRKLTLITGSYFDVSFPTDVFDAAVSVESLHHFTREEKIPLYARVRAALKASGYFLLTDYYAQSDEEEERFRRELYRLKREQNTEQGELYHYDTPLTAEHEAQALSEAGFSSVEVLGRWGVTYTLKACR
ncbi:MAG: class I SAM-dependent methyltransferase [Oscillospiraceae bacterium]|nr:class I SAM-dependent methyltransferase [Oscillospiraceae bacterium]